MYTFLYLNYMYNRSLGALRAPTSSWGPFGPLDFVLCALRALRPCDPRKHLAHQMWQVVLIFIIGGLEGGKKQLPMMMSGIC